MNNPKKQNGETAPKSANLNLGLTHQKDCSISHKKQQQHQQNRTLLKLKAAFW